MKHSSSSHLPKPEQARSGGNTGGPAVAQGFRLLPADPFCEAIHVDSCLPFERIAVTTQSTEYEVIVLPGHSGEVLIRGGRYFSGFRRAHLAGSTFGGSAIRVMTIEVGRRLELHLDGTRIVTSTIAAVSRVRDDGEGPRVM